MTDDQNLARVAALRARRGQPAVDLTTRRPADTTSAMWAPPSPAPQPPPSAAATRPAPTSRTTAPSRTRRRHVAGGARIVAAGLAVSGMFGLTAVLAAANRPATPSTAAPAVVPGALPTQQVTETIVLAVPELPVAAAAVPAASPPARPASSPVAATPAPAAAPAPVATAAPAPAPVVTQAPAPPPPAATTAPSGG